MYQKTSANDSSCIVKRKKKKLKKVKEKLICEGYRDMNSYQTHLPKISSSSPTPLKCSVS